MYIQQPTAPFPRRHPWLTSTFLVCAVWLAADGSYTLAGVTVAAAGLTGFRRHRRTRVIRAAGLSARAELEHRLALTGDPRGTFGRYPPHTAGWFADPAKATQVRYFDGAAWTEHVAVPTR